MRRSRPNSTQALQQFRLRFAPIVSSCRTNSLNIQQTTGSATHCLVEGGGALTNTTAKRTIPITVASFLFILFGLGMVIGNSGILAYIIYHGSAPVVFGIELLDGNSLIGMFWGLHAVVALGILLSGVAVLGAVAGFWLRRSLKKGGKLGMALLPFYLFFGVGFEIPALYVFVPLIAILLALGWRTLR